mmetsp:Transcript_72633/g.142458  ORF Transcript_72633/g.142458 Transcript_72633/m.142458 type:complete len:240 (-) Transcript_72633:243-962(-)
MLEVGREEVVVPPTKQSQERSTRDPPIEGPIGHRINEDGCCKALDETHVIVRCSDGHCAKDHLKHAVVRNVHAPMQALQHHRVRRRVHQEDAHRPCKSVCEHELGNVVMVALNWRRLLAIGAVAPEYIGDRSEGQRHECQQGQPIRHTGDFADARADAPLEAGLHECVEASNRCCLLLRLEELPFSAADGHGGWIQEELTNMLLNESPVVFIAALCILQPESLDVGEHELVVFDLIAEG